MKEPDRIRNDRKEIFDNWDNGKKDDVVLVEHVAWSFLPAARNVVIVGNKMIYMN